MTELRENYRIITARPDDLWSIAAIELAAARLLAGHAPDAVLTETSDLAALEESRRGGRLWIALAGDVPVGFAQVVLLERDTAHLDEIDVHPDHGRRGIGRQLVTTVLTWAAANGYRSMTLSTFRDVKWNMPFYASIGFEVVRPAALRPALAALVRDESRRGLDTSKRVIMERRTNVVRMVPTIEQVGPRYQG